LEGNLRADAGVSQVANRSEPLLAWPRQCFRHSSCPRGGVVALSPVKGLRCPHWCRLGALCCVALCATWRFLGGAFRASLCGAFWDRKRHIGHPRSFWGGICSFGSGGEPTRTYLLPRASLYATSLTVGGQKAHTGRTAVCPVCAQSSWLGILRVVSVPVYRAGRVGTAVTCALLKFIRIGCELCMGLGDD
jgi:hypothetical protein